MANRKSILEIIETDTDAARKLRLLTKYDGWILLTEILQLNEVIPLKEKLEDGEYDTIEERNRDKDKLAQLKLILTSPEFYIAALDRDPNSAPPPLDPYAQNIEEAKEVASPNDH